MDNPVNSADQPTHHRRRWPPRSLILVFLGIIISMTILIAPWLKVAYFTSQPPLHAAARDGNREALSQLLHSGADVNERVRWSWGQTYDGMTPLMLASQRGDAHAIRILLDAGADPTLKDPSGRTAYDHATQFGYAEAAELLRTPDDSHATE